MDYWLTGVLWSSEAASERAVRESIVNADRKPWRFTDRKPWRQ
jgi:hypothetical protein